MNHKKMRPDVKALEKCMICQRYPRVYHAEHTRRIIPFARGLTATLLDAIGVRDNEANSG